MNNQIQHFTEAFSTDWASKQITKEPNWCSVDLSEGNQSLAIPMTTKQKLALFELLVELGFKRIEVGSPGAYDGDFEFVRLLIENDLVPDDVTIQVVSQMKEKSISRTFEAINGAKRVSLNFFHSTALQKRQLVFANIDQSALIQKAVLAFSYAKNLQSKLIGTRVSYQYSMESFNTTEEDLLLSLVTAINQILSPTLSEPLILNFWVACDSFSPHLLASKVNVLTKTMVQQAPNVKFAFRAHNDRGCANALSELMLLCGVDFIEGGLFGLGYRAGSTCLTTLALNLQRMNVKVSLDLSSLMTAKARYEELTSHYLSQHHPYVGEQALSSFAPHEQYAIYKALQQEGYEQRKSLPYVPLLPCQIGRSYDSLIRINALSGRSGIAYIMETYFDFHLPYDLQREFSSFVKKQSLGSAKEICEDKLWDLFSNEYLCYEEPLCLKHVDFDKHDGEETKLACHAVVSFNGQSYDVSGVGSGALDSLAQAFYRVVDLPFEIKDFSQHALGHHSKAEACAYINIMLSDELSIWGVGIDSDATLANINALVSALNRLLKLIGR